MMVMMAAANISCFGVPGPVLVLLAASSVNPPSNLWRDGLHFSKRESGTQKQATCPCSKLGVDLGLAHSPTTEPENMTL